MARLAKALTLPEQGYGHRDHRSKKGRVRNYRSKKIAKKRLERLQNREGKWKI